MNGSTDDAAAARRTPRPPRRTADRRRTRVMPGAPLAVAGTAARRLAPNRPGDARRGRRSRRRGAGAPRQERRAGGPRPGRSRGGCPGSRSRTAARCRARSMSAAATSSSSTDWITVGKRRSELRQRVQDASGAGRAVEDVRPARRAGSEIGRLADRPAAPDEQSGGATHVRRPPIDPGRYHTRAMPQTIPSGMFASAYRTHTCGELRASDAGQRGPALGLGQPAARPGRADLPRPAGPPRDHPGRRSTGPMRRRRTRRAARSAPSSW